MKDTRAIINKINAYKDEAESSWNSWRAMAVEAYKMVMGDQWTPEVLADLVSKNAPALVINLLMKHLNVISGMERNARGDLKVLPIDGSDEDQAEVLSMVIKWIMQDRNSEFIVSDAFKDSLICGLGWLYTYITFDDDPNNGDIGTRRLSPFNILPDPHMVERDLSDCRYLIHHKKVWIDDVIRLYPEYKNKIEGMIAAYPGTNTYDYSTHAPQDRGEMLEITEFWHREVERVTFIQDSANRRDMQRWTGKKKDLKAFLAENPTFIEIPRDVQQMKLSVVVEGNLLVYDGNSPYEGNDYPFTPIFCFYFPAYDDWAWKCQGIIMGLKDIQREKNKRRSVLQQMFSMMPHSYWQYEKGAIDDPAQLQEVAGIGKRLVVNPGKMDAILAKPGPPIDPVAITLEQMNDNDVMTVGPGNPDILGQMLDRGAPGVAIKLRIQQGTTIMGEIFDSKSFAHTCMGRKIIYLVTNNWNIDKVKRIIGEDFYYTKKLSALNAQLQQVMAIQPQPVEVPPEFDQSDEIAHSMAEPGAKAIIEYNIMQKKNAAEQMIIQQQVQQIQGEIVRLKQEIQTTEQQESKFWVEFERAKREARYDCKVEESTSSPTYRYEVMTSLQEAAKYGLTGPVPLEILLEFLPGLPRSLKEKWLALNQQMIQQQMQMAQQQRQGGQVAG